MCELFGLSAEKEELVNDYLKEFYSHSDKHPHGWGLAYLYDGQLCIEKESLQASKSNYLKEKLSTPICSSMILAHIRFATIGNVYRKNCHPYHKRDNFNRRWTLIHNGTIFDYLPLRNFIKYQSGDTDSERILLYTVDKINTAQKNLFRPLSFEERFNLLDQIVADMSKNNKLNLIIYDGEYLYIHTNYKNSLYYLEKYNNIAISTRPLSFESWKNVPFTTLTAIKDGRFISYGKKHNNEYIDNEENMKNLYRIFSGL